MIFINLKTYEKGSGKSALEFAKQVEQIVNEVQVPVTILAQATDIRMLAENTNLPIWAEHVDNISFGKYTGWTLPEAVMAAGAKGTMINHAEHKLPLSDVSGIINKYKSEVFHILVSTTSPEEAIIMDEFSPTFISYEPQEYIGTKTSVVEAAPDILRNLASRLKTPLVTGAGIHKPEHITEGLALGVKGFLISSDVLLASDPAERLREYLNAFKNANNTIS